MTQATVAWDIAWPSSCSAHLQMERSYILVHQTGLADTAIPEDDDLQRVIVLELQGFEKTRFPLECALPSGGPSFWSSWWAAVLWSCLGQGRRERRRATMDDARHARRRALVEATVLWDLESERER